MKQRSAATAVAVVLIGLLYGLLLWLPTGYVVFRPGPTIDVLGEYMDQQIISINGVTTYPDNGALQMTTVYPSGPEQKLNLFTVLTQWLKPEVSILPRDAVYQAEETAESIREQSAAEMASSQDTAIAAALGALGKPGSSYMQVAEVDEAGPAKGVLEVGDRIVTVGGVATPDAEQLLEQIQPHPPGTNLKLGIRRDGARQKVTVTTVPMPEDATKSRIGVMIEQKFQFPYDITINLPDTIGGPSAGLMFALGIYDLLTPESLTNDRPIAGTGSITSAGQIGPIGGITQKIVGAQRDGAELFLAPEANCDEVRAARYDNQRMRILKASQLSQVIADIQAWAQDPDVELPGCER